MITNLHPSTTKKKILEALVNQQFPVVKVSRLYKQQNPLTLIAIELKDCYKLKNYSKLIFY